MLRNELWKFFIGNSEKYRLEEADVVSFKLGKIRKATWEALEKKYPRENFSDHKFSVLGVGIGAEMYTPKYLTAFCSKRADSLPPMRAGQIKGRHEEQLEEFLMTPEEEEMMRGQTPNFEIPENEKGDWNLYCLVFQNGKLVLPPMIFKEFYGPCWIGFRFAGSMQEKVELLTDRTEWPKLSCWFLKEAKEKKKFG
jgi:hypothetical protein